MNCPETNTKFFLIHPTPGWGFPGEWGGGVGQNFKSPGNFMNCRENRYIVVYPPPPPLPNRWGGVRSQNWRDGWEGGTDGREGGRDVMAIMKLTQCI